jgi:rRNA maturation endonuclease Nob1
MEVKNGELKVKRYCPECQKWYEVSIDIDECPTCGETLLIDPKEE